MRWLARLFGIGIWWITKWGILIVIADYFWTFFKSLADGQSVYQAMTWALFAFGACGLSLIALAKGFDYLASLLPEVIARRKVAAFFREMSLHGKHKAISLSDAVYFWNGGKNPETPMEVIQADFKLHHLKAAIGQGLLQAHGPGGLVKESTFCRPIDLAGFLGSWRWILVRDERWKGATYNGQAD
jgi:hypothetical protein